MVRECNGVVNKLSRRSTEQRQLLRRILQQADGHLDADEIHQQARRKSPGISLSTVYRNLQLFKQIGLIEEHQFGSRRYYERVPRVRHHHLVCLNCGRVFEFKCPSTERLKSRISREEGFRVTRAEVRLAGYCPECQEVLSGFPSNNTAVSFEDAVR
ncbi:MAG: transcriptional repressor [Dehalococcoidia bacterium]|nr:transcriptional repressor [Dehalococcoidia bacterium]